MKQRKEEKNKRKDREYIGIQKKVISTLYKQKNKGKEGKRRRVNNIIKVGDEQRNKRGGKIRDVEGRRRKGGRLKGDEKINGLCVG